MYQAYMEAKAALALAEVPIGCVIVRNQKIIARAHNLVETNQDALAHAEMLALKQASNITASKYLNDCDLYVTLEPCAMCVAAISLFKIRRLYFAAPDAKGGGVIHGSKFFHQPTCHHKSEVIAGIMEQECSEMLSNFFALLRTK